MRIEQLRHLLHVAESGSISRSARALQISQQGLSQSIHQLEKELETQLLYRDGNQSKLTIAGKLLRDKMETIVHCCDDMHAILTANAASISQGEKQVCRLRVTPHCCTVVIPSIIQRVSRLHPNLLLSVSENEILQILKEGDFEGDELFVLTCPERFLPQLLEKKGVFSFKEIYRTTIHAVVAQSHPLATRDKVTVDDLCTHPVVLIGSDIHLLRNVTGNRFKDVNIRLHTTNFELYREASAMKDVVSLTIPLVFDRVAAPQLVHVPIENTETIVLGYVVNEYARTSPTARELLDIIENELEKLDQQRK